MLEFMKEEANRTHTENGAVTLASTGSECLDLFATIGALRSADDAEIIARFIRAYTENPDTAMKLLFFARDIRGGLGERRVFRVLMNWLAFHEPGSIRKNLGYVAEYGRYDDLLSLMGSPCEADMLQVLHDQFLRDMAALEGEGSVSLLGKWLPSVNASCGDTVRMARKIAAAFHLREAEYRKALVSLRARIRILENNLREKDYSFDYEKQPSRALFKYRKAFTRNDAERYQRFLAAVETGEASLHADHVTPYELVEPYLSSAWYGSECAPRAISEEEKRALNATWASLPEYAAEGNALTVIDTSGSMYCGIHPLPAAVALSLGLYCAEHNKGVFRNHLIQFSRHPQLIELKGATFADRLRYAASFSEVANTNLEAVFDLILQTAVRHHVPQEELPSRLIIISDMEFDACVDDASADNFTNAQKKYAACGYRLPQIVFWNVASRNRHQPVRQNQAGVALVSGVTPRLFSMVAGGSISPFHLMMEILGSERYARIAA